MAKIDWDVVLAGAKRYASERATEEPRYIAQVGVLGQQPPAPQFEWLGQAADPFGVVVDLGEELLGPPRVHRVDR